MENHQCTLGQAAKRKIRFNTRNLLIAVILFLQGSSSYAQHAETTLPELSGPYLGQPPPGPKSSVFAPGFVSTAFGELNSVFTHDGKEFYFSRRDVPGKPSMILGSRHVNGSWTNPEPVTFTGIYSDIDLFLLPDGKSMVFCSTRPHKPGGEEKNDHDFWISTREGDAWSEPIRFAEEVTSEYEDFFPVVTSSGNLYFNSQRGGPGTNDIYCSTFKDGKYVPAEKLPEPINTTYREFDAFVAPDENMVLFSSNRPGGYGGSDIYATWKNNDGTWIEPVNLGGEINSAWSEYGSVISPDGKYFFYTSGKGGSEDIYWISAEVIRELKVKPKGSSNGVCTITYIANEGFLLGTGNKKILVDALFGGIKGNWCDQPGDSISNLMIRGIAPFDSIDIVLVTHRHSDHFNAQMTVGFLQNNAKSVLICPDQVTDHLKSITGYAEISGRIFSVNSAIHPDTTFIVNGVNIRAMRFKHGSWIETDSATGKQVDLHEGIENIVYAVEADGCRFLHTGDCNTSEKARFATYGLSAQEFDAAFVDRVFLRPEGQEILRNDIRTKTIVLMHIEPARREYYKTILREAPEFFVFSRQMEIKSLNAQQRSTISQ